MATKKVNEAPAEPPPSAAVVEVPVDAVVWEGQAREEFAAESLGELAASLKREGLLTPIRVRKRADGQYLGVCGERRFRAAKMNGDATILAVVVAGDLPEADVLAQQLAENEYREGLKPAERAAAYRRLMTLRNWTGKQLAEYLGVSGAKVCQELKLLDLTEEVQKDVDAGLVPASTAYEIAKADPEDRPELLRQVKEDGATRKDVQSQVRKSQGKKVPVKSAPAGDFRLSIPAGGRPYGFEVTANKIVVTGKKIGSVEALAAAAKLLCAAAEAARKAADRKPARPKKQPSAPALSPPTGTVPDGDTRSESPKEERVVPAVRPSQNVEPQNPIDAKWAE